MGGGYYDREVETSAPGQSSDAAVAALSRSGADPATNPRDRVLTTDAATPIVVCMDITGSMNDYPKIIYDKLPMFYGQIMIQNYVKDPALSFSFYAYATDSIPLQVSDFARGNDIDEWLRKMYFYSCGGGDEGLEYPSFFYGHRCTHSNVAPGDKGFFFIIGDSLPSFEKIRPDLAKSMLGIDLEAEMPMDQVFAKLTTKYHVFFVCRLPTTHGVDEKGNIPALMLKKWASWVGEDHILRLPEAKAVVDIMLGAMSLTAGTRTWDTYLQDLQSRGQSDDRIKTVYSAVHTLGKK